MTFYRSIVATTAGLLLAAAQAQATTINFDNLPIGTVLSNQYAGLGAVFSPNAFSGPGTSTSGMGWASNTDMTITSATGNDVGELGSPSLVGGNVLGSFVGWLAENGDPSFSIAFSTPVASISAAFAGVDVLSDVRLFAYSGVSLLGVLAASNLGQSTLSFAASSITRVVITPGSFNDWVAVDNIVFAPVPEPTTLGLMGSGLALVAFLRRRKAAFE